MRATRVIPAFTGSCASSTGLYSDFDATKPAGVRNREDPRWGCRIVQVLSLMWCDQSHGLRSIAGSLPSGWFLACLLWLSQEARPLQAEMLPGNILPNSTLESDTNGDGIPDFWHKGGSSLSIDGWTTSLSTSATHALQLVDNSAQNYGEWYSDALSIVGGSEYLLRYQLRYLVTNTGPMRVTVNFYDQANHLLNGQSYLFSGAHDFWEELTQQFTAPAGAAKLNLSFTSGGGLEVMGQAWLDDVSLAPNAISTSLVPYLENFPRLPDPLVIRDWKQTALDYHQLCFNPNITGPYLPLLYDYTVSTAAGYSGPAFGLPSYVGRPRDSGEGITVLGAVLGGTLAGMNMASLDGIDRVQACEAFYCSINGHGLVLNNLNSQGSGSAWYDIFPSTQFYQIGARYPGRPSFNGKMRAIADSWLSALPALSNNWEHAGFNFQTMTPVDLPWTEPDMAIGIAWLEYMAWRQFQDPRYLAAADNCMSQMDARLSNPFYEALAMFGPLLSARMNAELARGYHTSRFLNWVFSPGSDARPGWGCESGRWGDYDAYGLIGSTTDTSGYAFSMNSYTAAGLLAPVVRYDPRYARLLGRWLLHLAANANLFYPDTLPTNMQSSAVWSLQTGINSISYEGVRHLSVTTPYATGDAAEPVQDLNPYGAWASGYLATLIRTSNVPGILQVDCLSSDTFPGAAYPTVLLYNPYAVAQTIAVDLGAVTNHLYDAVRGIFVATNASGLAPVIIQPDDAVVLVECPKTAAFGQAGQQLLAAGVIIDYRNGSQDTDGDGMPDWWESRYFGNPTNAQPQTTAANDFNNLECYWLGLDPTDPSSTFKVQIELPSAGTFPAITWNTVGGKSYAVEYSDVLTTSASSYTQVQLVTETNAPLGVASVAHFVDDFTQTGGPPGPNGRYYRVRWISP